LSYGIERRPWDAWTVDLWDRFFAINSRGTWLMCRAIAPLMQQRRRGKIINLASDVTRLPASELLLPYACSKTAVHQITQSLARALGPSGVCVNSIAPGMTATEANLIQPNSEEMFAGTIAMQCVKRREEPEDLVGAAVFLASDSSDFVTGQLLVVDGGAVFV
jgi:3-oxoacyl-[acyl-carrier protein] reductase